MLDTARYAELFFAESREHLAAIGRQLLALERSPAAREPVDGIFRAAHTIKGMSAAMGYESIATLAHEMESLLDRVRSRDLRAARPIIDALFAAADTLEAAITSVAAGGTIDDERLRAGASRLATFVGAAKPADATPVAPSPASEPASEIGRLVRIRVAADAPMRGVRALLIVKRAETLGRLESVTPGVDALQRGEFGRGFSLRISSDAAREEIERALLAVGDVEAVSVDGGGDVEQDRGQSRAPKVLRRHVRVDTRRLDTLMNLAGELVIARGRLERLAEASGSDALVDSVSAASRLIAELQDEVIASRMLPAADVFERFPRVVRDAAHRLGKEVELVMEGGDIELDRSVLDVIGDPVVHLLRNAVDHGIEMPDVRLAAGKPAAGRITLTAEREHASVAIIVRDDGRGIDRDRVIATARAAGLLGADQPITDDAIARLIARPGFSTARAVTELSGRGVGIDVVAGTVRRLGGSLEITSAPGAGTSITLRLPPTLAIVRALLARVGDEIYALPAAHVVAALELRAGDVRTAGEGELLGTPDGALPLFRLRALLEMPAEDDTLKQVVLLRMGERRAALVIDELIEQQEIVVKSFDAVRGARPLFSGATILADGAPALILDVAAMR